MTLGEFLSGQAGCRIQIQCLESRPGNQEVWREEESQREGGKELEQRGGCPESLGQRSRLCPIAEGGSREQ